MNCAEIEILICDYVDGTLGPDARTTVERHLAGCLNCAELVPAATVMVGENLITLVFELVRVTTDPPAGALPARVTVPK